MTKPIDTTNEPNLPGPNGAPSMTAQEIFDQVAKHLLTQKARSMSVDGKCAYRGLDGLKCAVGCLIPDDIYTTQIESVSISGLLVGNEQKMLPADFRAKLSPHLQLLKSLQSLHDMHEWNMWEDKLRGIAEESDLTFPTL